MDTSTSYMGLRLKHPFVAGASPLSAHLDSVRRLEDAGVAAIVLHSLFEEQITAAQSGHIRGMDVADERFATLLAQFQAAGPYSYSPDEHLEHLRRVKEAVSVPVIASLNGTTNEAWLAYAKLFEDAGADAIEVNFYEVVADLKMPGMAVEAQIRDAVVDLKRVVHIPVSLKLSPFFTAFGNLACRLDEAGVDGLVIFNRFYQADIDVRTMKTEASLELSRSQELRLRLRWLAILHGHVRASLAVTGGIESPYDGIKAILAGADAVQTVSALLRHGPGYVDTLLKGLTSWMEWQHIASVDEMRGRVSLHSLEGASDFERSHYILALHRWNQ